MYTIRLQHLTNTDFKQLNRFYLDSNWKGYARKYKLGGETRQLKNISKEGSGNYFYIVVVQGNYIHVSMKSSGVSLKETFSLVFLF